jgi:ribosomal protein L11 methyltransferase
MVKELEIKDWVSEVERGFPPLNIGRFYVHGSHIKDQVPCGKIGLEINAGIAFGSGEHSTTSGCLLALGILAKKRNFLRPLDVGCGSGILALAMAKLWRVPVAGTDIDPVSVAVSIENARKNHVHGLTRFAVSDGYGAGLVRQHGPYDLITANILARPLVDMAPDLAKNLAIGGIAVLSGLLVRQERMVLSAHRAQGLRLISRINKNGWSTLILGF